MVKGESSFSLSRIFSICRPACILQVFFFFTLRSIFHSAVVLLPIMAYDETTRKGQARATRAQQLLGDRRGVGGCFLTDLDKTIKLKPPQHEISLFSIKPPCVAVQKAPQWAIYLYDSITYLRVLADPTSRPRPQTNDASKPQRTRPKKTPPASPSILTISSWKANLAAAVRRDLPARIPSRRILC